MTLPNQMRDSQTIELKLGIKSSLPAAKSVIGLIYSIWIVNNRQTEIEYSKEVGNDIELKDYIKQLLKDYFDNQIQSSGMNVSDFYETLNENYLLKSQIEALIVGLELIWRISKIEFIEDRPFSAERTGGVRYDKKLLLTKNIDMIDLLVMNNEEKYKKVLFNWITGTDIKFAEETEEKLVKLVTIMSEESVYRLRVENSEDIQFMPTGIYSKLITGESQVKIHDYKGNAGSLRILHTVLKENLNSFIKKDGRNALLQEDIDVTDLDEYNKRVNNYLDLTDINIEISYEKDDENDRYNFTGEVVNEEQSNEYTEGIEKRFNKSHNRILYGAPGTGKSHKLEDERSMFDENYERVTFHPQYSYAQFIGTYKPKPIYKEHTKSPRYSKVSYNTNIVKGLSDTDDEYKELYPIINESHIIYEFVPGPFLRALVKALNDYQDGKSDKHLLIIEEINRANVASVFGDVFQLLDRKIDGKSKYSISLSEEMKEYLYANGVSIDKLFLPPNFYIWATMNSADQGVYPIDTAFKRRWDFEYLHINNEENNADIEVTIKGIGKISWNVYRKSINKRLLELEVKEDKLIGPFFINPQMIKSDDYFEKTFKSKLLMYLYEDVLKHKKGFFDSEIKTYSDVLSFYNKNGQIYAFEINQYIDSIKVQEQESEQKEDENQENSPETENQSSTLIQESNNED